MTFPKWDQNNVLPPILPNTPEGREYDLLYRSPYIPTLVRFVTRFASTPERVELMSKFLDYRAALHQLEIIDGFQWINGSFVENIEQGPKNRPPGDIDVVTFYYGNKNQAQYLELFDSLITKKKFGVDADGIELGKPLDVGTAVLIGHVHSLWSHRRNDHVCKGFIQLDLDPKRDRLARHRLHAIKERQETL